MNARNMNNKPAGVFPFTQNAMNSERFDLSPCWVIYCIICNY